ncbi:dipeptidase [Microvirga zambiensis]|uniref:dipeptidase n=1 Tax=Microvirga zambiensis TaxID=1402137 RepID=UPI00191EB060|nr:membrane dipeptidase [Microvirga zambiensis]
MYDVVDLLNGARVTAQYVNRALSQGILCIHVTVNNFSVIDPYPDFSSSMRELAAIRKHLAALDNVRVVEEFADITAARSKGKLAVILGYQNIPFIGRDLRLLDLYHNLGVRIFQISHNARGLYADGCDEPSDAGLSTLGRELVSALNELGILIDLSHTGEQSSIEAAQISTRPVAATHANAHSVLQNARNKGDGSIDAIAKTGGIIGLCYLPPIVKKGAPTKADLTAHAVYLKDRMGSAGLAIGSDFIDDQPDSRYANFLKRPEVYGEWPWRYPVESLEAQQEWLSSLADDGFTEEDISALAGGNALRVLEQVWRKQ